MIKIPAPHQQSAISNQQSVRKADSRKLKTESFEYGFSAIAVLTLLGLFLAVSLALVGTGIIKLPNDTKLAVSPIPVSDPVEDDTACNDPYNADCETINHDPEDLTPQEIQRALDAS